MFNVLRNWIQRYFSDEEAVVLAVLLVLAFTVVLTLGGMLAPVLAGMVLAYLMQGLVVALERLRLPGAVAVGLVFAITAIPVLYLYLRHIDYPPAASRRLVQSAIVIDLTCWSLFGLAQGSLKWTPKLSCLACLVEEIRLWLLLEEFSVPPNLMPKSLK